MSTNEVAQTNHDAEREGREMLSALVRVAVTIWRAQRRLQDNGLGNRSVSAALKHLERASTVLHEIGIDAKDYNDEMYDPGMAAFVTTVAFQEQPQCTKETIIETMAPAIFFRGKVMAKSEVVVGVPALNETLSAEGRTLADLDGSIQCEPTQSQTAISTQPTPASDSLPGSNEPVHG